MLIDICTQHFFVALFPYAGDSTPLCLPVPSPSVFKMGTRLTGNILLVVSLWWTSTPLRGSSNTPRHCMVHAKETGISFGCSDLWSMFTISLLLNILNAILNLSKYQSQSHQLAVWSLRSEVSSLKSAGRVLQTVRSAVWILHSELCRLSSAAWGLQSEVCSLRFAGRVLQPVSTEVYSLNSAACSLQTDICSVRSADRVLQSKFYIVNRFWSRPAV